MGTLFKQSGEFSDDFEKEELNDDSGAWQGRVSNNRKFMAKLVFTPVAAEGTNTIANAQTSLEPPAMNASVVLAGFDWALANSEDGLKWMYDGGWKISGKNNGIWSYELNLIASADPEVDIAANPLTY